VLIVTLLVCVAVIDAVAHFALGVRGSRHGSEDFVQFSPVLGHFHKPLAQGRYYPRRGATATTSESTPAGSATKNETSRRTVPA